jgi:hypothetical protein
MTAPHTHDSQHENENKDRLRGNEPPELLSGLIGSQVASRLLAMTPERLPAAEDRMNHNGAYATVVIPPRTIAGSRTPLASLTPTVPARWLLSS